MKFLSVAVENGKDRDYLWGIDLKTNQFVYCELLDSIKEKLTAIGDVLVFKEEYLKGSHEVKTIDQIEIEKSSRDTMINILNSMASYPACVEQIFVKNNVLKIRRINGLEKIGNRVTANVDFCGIEGQYKAIINDAKWVNFWKNESDKAITNENLILALNDIKNRFLILDYRQQFFGNELVFSGMVVDYG